MLERWRKIARLWRRLTGALGHQLAKGAAAVKAVCRAVRCSRRPSMLRQFSTLARWRQAAQRGVADQRTRYFDAGIRPIAWASRPAGWRYLRPRGCLHAHGWKAPARWGLTMTSGTWAADAWLTWIRSKAHWSQKNAD